MDVQSGEVKTGCKWTGLVHQPKPHHWTPKEDGPSLSSFLVVCDYHYDDPFIFYYS